MKKFLDGPVEGLAKSINETIADDAFTFAEYDEAAGEKVAWTGNLR